MEGEEGNRAKKWNDWGLEKINCLGRGGARWQKMGGEQRPGYMRETGLKIIKEGTGTSQQKKGIGGKGRSEFERKA